MPTTLRRSDEIRAIVADALVRAGATPSDAVVQADMLTEAELRGHPSHGIRRLPVLAERLRRGLIVSGGAPTHEWRGSAALLVDGDQGFGPVVARQALEVILDRAAETGVAAAVIRNAHHLGMMAPYLERITARGCAGLVFTTSEALVHPWGGASALVGTNPIGIGIPSGDEPIILDMSTGATSAGRILDRAARGEPLPEGWAVDSAGRATTDAAAAVSGAISPFGGAKGYALGVALEVLVGSLTATAFGRDVRGTLDVEHPVTKGDVMIVFSTDLLPAEPEALADYLVAVRASGRGDSPVGVPGDRARRERRRSLAEGVLVDDGAWADAASLAGRAA